MTEEKVVRYDKALTSLTQGLTTLTERVSKMDLMAPGVEIELQRLAVSSQEARDIGKDRRDREAAPYEVPLKEVKDRWRPIIDGFDNLFRRIKVMASDVLTRKRQEEGAKRRAAETKLEEARKAEQSREEAEKKGNVQVPARVETLTALREARAALDSLPPAGAPIGVKTESGTLSGREVWKWKVEDIALVPDIYCQKMVEGDKVDFAIKNGLRAIPGIKVWPEIEMVSRRTKG